MLTAWLNGTNPIVDPALSASGTLTFTNAAEQAGVAKAAERYTIAWSRFDNAAGTHQPAGDEVTVTDRRAQAPASLLSANPEFVAARLRAVHPDRPDWAQPLMVYFRRGDAGWTLVGLERAIPSDPSGQAPVRHDCHRLGRRAPGAPLRGESLAQDAGLRGLLDGRGPRACGRAALPRRGRALPVQVPARVRRRSRFRSGSCRCRSRRRSGSRFRSCSSSRSSR